MDLYTYASHQENRCQPLGESLLVVNPNNIQLLRQGGTVLYDLQVSMNAPLISVGTKLAAVCDAGGSKVYVLDSAGLCWSHTSADGLVCYSARMSQNDYLTVTEQKAGYKTSATVYNKNGEAVFRFDSHDSYLSDATVTDDGKHLVAVALDVSGGAFTSDLQIYDLETAEKLGSYPLRDSLVLDMNIREDSIVTLCDKRLSITTLSGEAVLNYAYGELYLHDYDLSGGDFCTLLLGRYQSGNIAQLTTFSFDGEPIATIDLTEEVLDMSAAGKYLAVLYSDTLVIYDRTLTEFARLEGTDYAGHVQMSEDRTALLIVETSAWRFLP